MDGIYPQDMALYTQKKIASYKKLKFNKGLT